VEIEGVDLSALTPTNELECRVKGFDEGVYAVGVYSRGQRVLYSQIAAQEPDGFGFAYAELSDDD
jgi:hypothetical protein